MIIIKTIRKLIYNNGCYYVRVISQIVLFFNTIFEKAFDYLYMYFVLLLGTFFFPGKKYSLKGLPAPTEKVISLLKTAIQKSGMFSNHLLPPSIRHTFSFFFKIQATYGGKFQINSLDIAVTVGLIYLSKTFSNKNIKVSFRKTYQRILS